MVNFTDQICNVASSNYSYFINRHVLNDLKYKMKPHEVTEIVKNLNRLNNDASNIEDLVVFFHQNRKSIVPQNITLENANDLKLQFDMLDKILLEKTQINFNLCEDVEKTLLKLQVDNYCTLLETSYNYNAIKFLFDQNILPANLFTSAISSTINEENYNDIILEVMALTHNNNDYLLNMLDVFVSKYTHYIVHFKNDNRKETFLEFIRMKLCAKYAKYYNTCANEFTYESFSKSREIYNNLMFLVNETLEKNTTQNCFVKKINAVQINGSSEELSVESDFSIASQEENKPDETFVDFENNTNNEKLDKTFTSREKKPKHAKHGNMHRR